MQDLLALQKLYWPRRPVINLRDLCSPNLSSFNHDSAGVSSVYPQTLLRKTRSTALKRAKTLDRIRAFRRRQDSPNGGPNAPEPRARSPSWFQRMHRNGSSSKRSRSTSTQRTDSSATEGHGPLPENGAPRDEKLDTSLKMPAFLQQTQGEIQAKFLELTWMERNRVLQGVLDQSPDHQWATSQGPHLELLDRYRNVRPWSNNRIHLRVPEGQNDYINASPISLRSQRTGKESRYIAMQGPKEGSTNHVWRMVWDELASPAVIVMLTETHEAGQEKCFPYFPRDPEAPPMVINEDNEFGDGFKATVTCTEVAADLLPQGDTTEVRKLIMKVDGKDEERVIWHLLYTKWPDFGVLAGEDLEGFFALMELSTEKNSNPHNPRIIHCSAGIGRSGTFIALEYLMNELSAGALEPEDGHDADEYDPVFDTVNRLREQRRTMVQANAQYAFIYSVLRKLWEQKHPAPPPPTKPVVLPPPTGEPTAKVAKVGDMEDVFG